MTNITRPNLDQIRFTSINRKRINWLDSSTSLSPINCCYKIDYEDELSNEWNAALDAFLPWAIELMALSPAWENGQVESISVAWEWSGEDWLMKINSIAYSRSTLEGEVPMARTGKTGNITMDNFDIDTVDLLHDLWDQCWKYIQTRPQQLSFLEPIVASGTRSKAPQREAA